MTVGDDTVVAAGAVVPRPAGGVVAAGVPARVLREIGPEDTVAIPDDASEMSGRSQTPGA